MELECDQEGSDIMSGHEDEADTGSINLHLLELATVVSLQLKTTNLLA